MEKAEWTRERMIIKESSSSATSPMPINNTIKLDDLSNINLPPDSDQDQREELLWRKALVIREKPAQIRRAINKKQCPMAQREELLLHDS